jgi:predicted dehydrogenase
MIRVGLVGIGFMGWIHYLAYQRSSMAKLTAFCSRDAAKRAGDWTNIKGNFGPPGEKISVEELQVYETLDAMIANPDIDMIDICLPPHMHVEAACRALAAGKHVLCEKPLGLNTVQCDEIMHAADKAQRKVMVAQVLPYMGEFQFLYQAATDGRYGRPISGYFKRIISPPDWIPDFYDPNRVGGPLIDLHVHDTHFIRLLFGMPQQVMCLAEMQDGVVKYCQTLMEFQDRRVNVATSSGVGNQSARPFCHGFEVQFEKATIQFELSALADGVDIMPLKVLHQNGAVERPALAAADEVSAFAAEIDDAAKAIESDKPELRLDGHFARDAIHICQCLQKSAEHRHWIDCR